MKVDKTVKAETLYIAAWCIVLSVFMQAVFLVIAKWNLYVLFGNLWGILTAVLNFFFMGLGVQKAVTQTPEDARTTVKLSQTLRNIFIIIMTVIGIVIPFFNSWTVVIPLLFPRISMFLRGFRKNK